jgi:hypothetical protein
MNFLKLTPIRVRFSPRFLSGAGFLREQFAPAWFWNSGVPFLGEVK